MADLPRPPFDCVPGLRLSAHETVIKVQMQALGTRVEQLERMLERLERRLWLTVYGMVAVILAQALQSLIAVQ